jgi:hypothetical protein
VAQQAQAAPRRRSNSGMHPTADTRAVINLRGAARRVMPALDCCCDINILLMGCAAAVGGEAV